MSVIEIIFVGVVVNFIVSHHSARTGISMPVCNGDIRAYIGFLDRERKKFNTRRPPIGEKDDYNSENSWISDGLPSSSRRRRRGEGRGEAGEWREKCSASEVDVGVDGAKSEIKVERSCDPG